MTGRFIIAPPLQVVGKVATMDENSLPDCRVAHTSTREGRLAETLPAVLMHHEALQELQLQLVPFQVKLLSAVHCEHASVCCRVLQQISPYSVSGKAGTFVPVPICVCV